MVRKLRNLKEVSEMVAGPKWKNFIRKMGGYLKGKRQRNKFQYDPESYAQNFNGGLDGEDDCPLASLQGSKRYDDPFFVVAFDRAPTVDSETFNKLDQSIRDAHESQVGS